MPENSTPHLPAAEAGRLPAEIEAAISQLVDTSFQDGIAYESDAAGIDLSGSGMAVAYALNALRAVILARLTAADSARTVAIARAERLEKALKPFAAWVDELEPEYGDHADDVIVGGVGDAVVTFGDLRGARAALASSAHVEET